VERLTIGAFSRASRLSPKALRLYDSLGLLAPAHVDTDTLRVGLMVIVSLCR
jgi:protein phosphatase